jgi:hypothetical protein
MNKSLFLSMFVSAMFLACTLTTSPATPTSVVPVPEIILTEVLQNFDNCRLVEGIEAADSTYSFSCSNSADTIYTVSMTSYTSEITAHSQFESNRGNHPVSCFHGYDLFEIFSQNSDDQPSRINHQELHWQAGQWVFSIYASYDYGFFHFNTNDFAEAVYTSGIEHDLFQAGTCPTTGTASP